MRWRTIVREISQEVYTAILSATNIAVSASDQPIPTPTTVVATSIEEPLNLSVPSEIRRESQRGTRWATIFTGEACRRLG